MQNVKMTVKNGKLIIEVDLNQEFGLSKSGKSISIASTLGNKSVKDDIKIGLNVYKSAPVGVKN
jgi:hypothetical protein